MQKQQFQAASAVVAAAVGAFIYYGLVLGVTFGGRFQWHPVVEGALVGAAVLVAWRASRSRSAAVVGLAVAIALVLLGAIAFGPALVLFETPIGWAVLLALGVRMAVPEAREMPEEVGEQATP